jgi:hypothetical protein
LLRELFEQLGGQRTLTSLSDSELHRVAATAGCDFTDEDMNAYRLAAARSSRLMFELEDARRRLLELQTQIAEQARRTSRP